MPSVNGKTATLLAAAALIVGGGGSYYATSGPHRYTQAEADRDITELRSELKALRHDVDSLETLVRAFAVTGPTEVRSLLEKIEIKLDKLRDSLKRYP